ncbi:hypothetical protein [Victivallis sp. Marseille-Q1083]|uniref:hypothetical protein n=1 Tax=Victivallis sp. Marseille-Q1083 TaxID=2717288 RepID=UPI00158F1FAA|nr:hypothetical protein [Victivallis sp. Marseille-Q1083]
MIKRWTLPLLAAVSLLGIATGCSSVESASSFNALGVAATPTQAISHLNSTIYGYYFFGIPILTGSVGRSNSCAIFTDTVTLDKALLQMNKVARAQGASKVINLSSRMDSNWVWYTLLFSYREVQISGTAVK